MRPRNSRYIPLSAEVAGLYEARGTAYMYAGRHDQALADYSLAIELDPEDARHSSRPSPTKLYWSSCRISPEPWPTWPANSKTPASTSGLSTSSSAAVTTPPLPSPPMIRKGPRRPWLTAIPSCEPVAAPGRSGLAGRAGHGLRADPEADRLRARIHDSLAHHREADRHQRLTLGSTRR